jgi:hypothetical protein
MSSGFESRLRWKGNFVPPPETFVKLSSFFWNRQFPSFKKNPLFYLKWLEHWSQQLNESPAGLVDASPLLPLPLAFTSASWRTP